MTYKQFTPWTDIFLFGGISLFGVVVAILVSLRPDNAWWGVLMTWVVVAAILAVSTVVLHGKFSSRPDYITKHGVAVWNKGIVEITPELMEQAFENYTDKVGGVLFEGTVITRDMLQRLYQRMLVEWSRDRVSDIGNGWLLTGKAGLAKNCGILVWWPGRLGASALLHEIHHTVWDEILKKPADYNHAALDWWRILGEG